MPLRGILDPPMAKQKQSKNPIVIYKSGQDVRLDVRLQKDTVWLSLDQIVRLFGRDKSVISRHIRNIFAEKELKKNSVVANFATTAADGKTYYVDYYNLDVIISVGYRVKSQRGVQFRIWATKTLKDHLVQGYTVNQRRLLETREKLHELQTVVSLFQKKSEKEQLAGQEKEILSLLSSYAKTLTLLDAYDKGAIHEPKGSKMAFGLEYEQCQTVIAEVKKVLVEKGEASDLFGVERSGAFEGIIRGLYQSFGGKELYPTLEAKAAHHS